MKKEGVVSVEGLFLETENFLRKRPWSREIFLRKEAKVVVLEERSCGSLRKKFFSYSSVIFFPTEKGNCGLSFGKKQNDLSGDPYVCDVVPVRTINNTTKGDIEVEIFGRIRENSFFKKSVFVGAENGIIAVRKNNELARKILEPLIFDYVLEDEEKKLISFFVERKKNLILYKRDFIPVFADVLLKIIERQ